MASAKDLKKKIRAVTNTKKITRTMELVATAKAKRAQDRVTATTPYTQALSSILGSLSATGTVKHKLFETPVPEKGGLAKTLVIAISANRGFCGGYNSNVLSLTERTIKGVQAEKKTVETWMFGKKGASRFRYSKIPVEKSFIDFEKWTSFADAEAVGDEILAAFMAGKLERVLVVYTKYYSSGVQKPAVAQLLPIVPVGASATGAAQKSDAEKKVDAKAAPHGVEFIFEPGPREILDALLPLSVKTAFYRIVLESITGEHIARRVAMKTATDNAEEMTKYYTRFYNRTRQASITQQINEIVSGANALE